MSRAASNGRFDLDAAAAAAVAESEPAPFLFSYKGADYEVPPATSWPLEAQSLIGKGELERALVMLLGQEPYERLVAAGMTVGELNVLFTAVGEAAGMGDLPNLSPPAPAGSTQT
jgi:hypothetical protein